MELFFEKKFKEFKEKLNISDENNEILESLLTNLMIDVRELDFKKNEIVNIKNMFKNNIFVNLDKK